jgi:predicted nucleotidyltransferase
MNRPKGKRRLSRRKGVSLIHLESFSEKQRKTVDYLKVFGYSIKGRECYD